MVRGAGQEKGGRIGKRNSKDLPPADPLLWNSRDLTPKKF
jgi:hypothetical protein